jgi:hypothetical protein
MNIYARKVGDIVERSGLNESLEQIEGQPRKPRNGKGNRTMRKRFLGPQIQQAGMELLERINKECRIGATEDELREEQEQLHTTSTRDNSGKPELTIAYLKSIGKESYGSW